MINKKLASSASAVSPTTLPESIHALGSLFIRHNDYWHRCLYDDLLWLQAGGSYCDLHFRDGKHFTVTCNLSFVLLHLPAKVFCRIHHSYAVNLHAITKFYGNTVCLGTTELPISRSFRSVLLSRLNILGNY